MYSRKQQCLLFCCVLVASKTFDKILYQEQWLSLHEVNTFLVSLMYEMDCNSRCTLCNVIYCVQ